MVDGNPATLKPARERALAQEIARLAGGTAALAARAMQLAGQAVGDQAAPDEEAGNEAAEESLRLAGHLAELAWLADPADLQAREAKRRVFTVRTDRATSTMAKAVFRWAASEAEEHAGQH